MKTYLRFTLSCALVLISVSVVYSQDFSLRNRSVVEINLGMWGGSKVSNSVGISGVQSTADVSSFVGSVAYAYGIREYMAATLSVGVLGAGASANVGLLGVSGQSGVVIPILLGVRYYVPSPEPNEKVRPFLSLGVGTYVGSQSSSSVGFTVVQESTTETVFGGRAGAGIDFYLTNSFKLVVNAGYNLMSDFSSPVTGRMNFNGGDFSIGAGYAF